VTLYLVKCDSETTTQNDINLGIVNILVGFAPLETGRICHPQDSAACRPGGNIRDERQLHPSTFILDY
jgi:hypothetical protein